MGAFAQQHRLGLFQRDVISRAIDPEQHIPAPDLLVVLDRGLDLVRRLAAAGTARHTLSEILLRRVTRTMARRPACTTRPPSPTHGPRARASSTTQPFVRFPSVSAQPQHAADVRNCAAWLAGHLHRIGLDHVQVAATAGHPVVYADWGRVADRPTLLVYGHYDVQPADPVAEWLSPRSRPWCAATICSAAARPTTRGSYSRT